MAGSFYTHFALGDSFERMAPSLIFGLLLVCRLIILLQVIKKEKQDLEEYKEYIKAQMEQQQRMENEDKNSKQTESDHDVPTENLEEKKAK
jgi:hypothetical protein